MSIHQSNTERVRTHARGEWLRILPALAPPLIDAVGRFPRHGPCPIHGGHDGFRLFRDADETGGGICNTCGAFHDGFELLRWLNGWTFSQTIEEVASFLGLEIGWDAPRPEELRMGAIARMRELWWESTVDDGRISAYLRERGLSGTVPPSLRIHRAMPYYDSKTRQILGFYPAIIAPVQSANGRVVALHRTYLDPSEPRKANVSNPKKLTPPIYPGATRGAGIRLARIAPRMGITEGIETGLAIQEHFKIPVLAAVSAGNLEVIDIPDGVKEVHIYADNDLSGAGQRASAKARRHLLKKGIVVNTTLSPKLGHDWLDVIVDQHLAG